MLTKEGRTDEGHVIHRHAAQDSRGWEEHGDQVEEGKGGKRRDKRWRPTGRGDVHVDRRSMTG